MLRPARRDPSKLVDAKGFREFVRHHCGPAGAWHRRWLTGCSAEGAVLVPHSDDDAELWIGPVPGTAATGLPCRPIHDLPRALRGTLPTVNATTQGVDPLLDALTGPDHSAQLQRVKDGWEVGQLESAVDATVQGFADVAAELKTASASASRRSRRTLW